MRFRLHTKVSSALLVMLTLLFGGSRFIADTMATDVLVDVKRAQLDAEFHRFRQQLDDEALLRERTARSVALLGESLYASHRANPAFDARANADRQNLAILEGMPSSILGIGLFYEPHAFAGEKWFCPYANRTESGALRVSWEYATDEYNYPSQSWYTQIIPAGWDRSRRIVRPLSTSAPFTDRLNGQPVVFQTTAHAMHAPDGRVIGVSTVDATLTSIQTLLGQFRLTPSSSVFLIDPSHKVLFPVPRTDTLSDASSLPYHRSLELARVQRGEVRRVRGVAFNGHVHDIAYTRTHGGNILGVVLATDEAYAVLDRMREISATLAMVTILLVAFCTYLLVRRLLRPLAEVTDAARVIASGNLDVAIGVHSSDEIGELGDAFRTMVENLRVLLARIGTSAASVSAAAAGMFAATSEHEASATQQAASVEEMRRTLESLAAAAGRVNEDASLVRAMAERTLGSSRQTADQTRLVREHADRIGDILTLIQDIAHKVDLLALNAAVEGTRAGEAGRGFSLVAAEMRRLSEHVVASVRDIRTLIGDMRSASQASVIATEESIRLAKDTATSATKISQAVGQQLEGTAQVKVAADEIVSVVHSSLEGTAEITRSAESLHELSKELRSATEAMRTRATSKKA